MLREEGFHLVMGYQGMQRIVAAGHVPVEIHQRYIDRMMCDLLRRLRRRGIEPGAAHLRLGLKAPWGGAQIDPARANAVSALGVRRGSAQADGPS